jgi:hypothetical protein
MFQIVVKISDAQSTRYATFVADTNVCNIPTKTECSQESTGRSAPQASFSMQTDGLY